ncbi:hypothetical protein [Pandoraea sp. SD6-2]|uniref:hypothetical protein n=1 Tax=Pandoraea sp. SD6-2 TaxID=1286093 RepID=UPI00032E51E8|nr:hypothetical protein [Pandoraea sp. SD6-2]EON13122.1 gp38 [Pandoraea sp. SD6-2]
MSDIKNGGAAFPVAASEYGGHGTAFGMTVRDYFAAKALPEAIKGWDEWRKGDQNPEPNKDWTSSCEQIAEDAYKMADAMIRARGET